MSRSGYYKWLRNLGRPKKDKEDKIRITDLYTNLKGIYGYRRLKVLYDQKYKKVINHKKIYRIMKELGLRSIIRRKRKNFYKSAAIIKPNILSQNFRSEKINRKWATDVTNLYYQNSRIYLSIILDLYNREVISYSISQRNDNLLVIGTIKGIMQKTNDLKGIILHSDQGYQYTTEYYSNLLSSLGIIQSMSRRGNCLDNAPVECFFSHLKSELMYTTKFSSKEEMIEEVEKYIKFYNTERIQIKLNKMSPVCYKNQLSTNS